MTNIPSADVKIEDADLTATAQEIKRLQSIIDDQRQQLIRANTRADNAEAARDDYEERLDAMTEKYKASKILLENIVTPQRKEVFPFRDITAIELQRRINDGWEILHMQFMANPAGEDRLNVVLSRECPAPQPERAPLVTAVPNSQMTIIPSVEALATSSRAQQLINASNARIEAAAPLSPVTADFLRFMAAVQS